MGACSFDGSLRTQNQKNLLKYLDDASQGNDLAIFKEQLSEHDVWLEKLMLGLRQVRGLPLSFFAEKYSASAYAQFTEMLAGLERSGLVVVNDGIVRLTKAGRSVENEIVLKLSLV